MYYKYTRSLWDLNPRALANIILKWTDINIEMGNGTRGSG